MAEEKKVKRVLVAMSGGVDSSMSCKLLMEQGYEVAGAYMKLHDRDASHEANIASASRVAEFLGIEFRVLDKREEFLARVYTPFINEYKAGRTPNPCVLCNRNLKFGAFLDYVIANGFDFAATGHYIRNDGEFFYESLDKSKDQSYFLFNVKKEALKRLIFPLGNMVKKDVKSIAANIPELKFLADRKESSEICFVENDYTEILARHFPINALGETLDLEGNVIGDHKGYMNYTIGKRRGFYAKGAKKAMYVKEIIPEKNQIVVTTKENIFQSEFFVKDINLFFTPQNDVFETEVKVRYRNEKKPAKAQLLGENRAKIVLRDPEFAIAGGQAAVFYENDKLLGGGFIE
ncbi:MAG: tRNA 2-thiouridine(34) synthase MnmA [Helicobacteraceae bacterium]|jgi:tRNA-specific 2-thiouridylase|nr:tRNA 2-thiouridine(34) synthase MnmA [Helicobacteraceae bacterium]